MSIFSPYVQMWHRIVVGILLAVAAYFVVQHFSTENFTSMNTLVVGRQGMAPILEEPIPRGNLAVASGGPNSPNVAAPTTMPATLTRSPEANDPYDETMEAADAPERLRNPERSFGPGIVPEQTAIATSSGIAGPPAASAQPFQQFGPELVSSGGAFFGTVSALEDENPNYSAF